MAHQVDTAPITTTATSKGGRGIRRLPLSGTVRQSISGVQLIQIGSIGAILKAYGVVDKITLYADTVNQSRCRPPASSRTPATP